MSFAQELLHRSSTKLLLLKFLYFSFLAAGAARRWLTKRDPLRELYVLDVQTCGQARILFALEQPSVEIVRVGRASVWGECEFGCARRHSFARNDGRASKTDVKLSLWNFRCKPFGVKLGFYNIMRKYQKAGVKLHVWNLSSNPVARNDGRMSKTEVKLQFSNLRRNFFARKDGWMSKTGCKIAVVRCQMQHCRAKCWSNGRSLGKIAILQSQTQPPFARNDGRMWKIAVKLRFRTLWKLLCVKSSLSKGIYV